MIFRRWKMDLVLSSLMALALLASPWVISWYGRSDGFHGRPTASGVPFDADALTTACHASIPLGTVIEVTNPASGASVRVVCNDRGPFRWTGQGWAYISPYRLDLSEAAFRAIASPSQGIINGAEVIVGVQVAEAQDDSTEGTDSEAPPSGTEETAVSEAPVPEDAPVPTQVGMGSFAAD